MYILELVSVEVSSMRDCKLVSVYNNVIHCSTYISCRVGNISDLMSSVAMHVLGQVIR